MKNKFITSIVLLITGALIAIGPQTIFKVCSSSKMLMKCYWSAKAEIGVGIVLIITGILYFLLKKWQARMVLTLLGLITGIIAILVPAVLVGGCTNKMMVCRSLSFPAIYLISFIVIIFTVGNSIYLYKKKE